MAWEFLGEGGVVDAGAIGAYVDQVPDGNYARLAFDLRASPAGWMVEQIQNILRTADVPGVRVSTGSPVLNVDWIVNRGVAGSISMEPLTAVAIIIAAIAVILLLVIGWSVWTAVPSGLKGMTATLVLIGGAILAAAISYSLFRRKY